jgi:multicomponent Na+:H+ antiporter subunit G
MAILVGSCVVMGLFFLAVAAVGMLRFPDVYTRSHALGVTDTLGASLVLIGLALNEGPTLTAGRILVILLLLLFLNPVISHATVRAALRVGLKPWTKATS